jgi:Carboxypeptidase regulatory-like domain
LYLQMLRNVAFLGLGVWCAAAQESIQYGSIGGRVEDSSGAVVRGAKVTARQKDTNIMGAMLTGNDGRFRFPYLSVGDYEITVQAAGFAETTRSVSVRMGSAFELPIVLSVAASQSKVEVSAEADLLEAARTQIAGTISPAEVNSLPLNGRNFLDLALLVPGVSPTNTAASQLLG